LPPINGARHKIARSAGWRTEIFLRLIRHRFTLHEIGKAIILVPQICTKILPNRLAY
jgi:hypothetical protein